MVVDRLELIYTPRWGTLAHTVARDIATVSPDTVVRLVAMDIADPWDFGEEIERVAVRSRAPILSTGPTGAAADRAGLLHTAHEGVLFLDKIGELGADEQAMLLMAVEEKRFFPMGSDHEVSSDFQLIAGTNRNLRVDVQEGRFRADLYARINLWAYILPGLAQRPEDLEPNVEHLLALATAEIGRAVRFNAETQAKYLAFAQSNDALWSGNFRDLSASITRLATLADCGRISTPLVEAELQRLNWLWQRSGSTTQHGSAVDLGSMLGAD